MDYEIVKQYSQEDRDRVLKGELESGKVKLLEYYGLHCNDRLYWSKSQGHYPTQEYFSHRLVKKASVIGIIFHIYRLCYAKTKYFEQKWHYFVPCQYDWNSNSFYGCEVYKMEFIKHKDTGITLDLRNLAKINRIEDFRMLCDYIESGCLIWKDEVEQWWKQNSRTGTVNSHRDNN
jgi:hypothetical protein